MPSKPTFLFIPGSWHTPAYFDSLIAKLASEDFKSQTVFLPSAGIEPAIESMEPDIQAIMSKLSSLLDEGTDVIVVAHSYGGECGSAAVGRMFNQHSGSNGKIGKIQRMIFVCAFVPTEGESHMTMMSAIPNPVGSAIYRVLEVSSWICMKFYLYEFSHLVQPPWVSMNEHALEVMCHDVSEPMRIQWGNTIRKHAAATLLTPIMDPGWRYVPTTYVYTSLDRAIYLKTQQWLVQRIRETGLQQFGSKAFNGEAGEFMIESGHMPFLSRVDELANVLTTVARM